MTSAPDLAPAARRLGLLLAGVRDSQLAAPTPCVEYTLGDLIDHVGGLSKAFTWSAEKNWPDVPSTGPSGDASRLAPDWRARIPEQLDALAAAWTVPDAWQGMTKAGGVDLPGEVAGRVALNEIVVHGWDVARASGQPYEPGRDEIDLCMELVGPAAGQPDGPFGPVFATAEDAPPLDRLIGLTGRDPAWTPPA
ncbi:TIGR03086 family protein [Actinomadura graeca]|uniref:TIGR03086 family protein n=1 Tax=Actinomadura graeca TaxID=2750812 RepID=A0ABX8QVK5_9ACTN|nr:TIGR03086 family metal-binding protein [Actinomadura graeca]QXJ22805.1 TIGR03086 family protein [Actinomadura graeca]